MVCTETTRRVLHERRLLAVQTLATAIARATDELGVLQSAGILGGLIDGPFLASALVSGGAVTLAATVGDAPADLQRLLAELGHDVRIAHDGPAALAALESFAADVVLLDIGLPGMDGYELATRVRRERDPVPMLVAITGYAPDGSRAARSGIAHHLVKPVRLEVLEALLR